MSNSGTVTNLRTDRFVVDAAMFLEQAQLQGTHEHQPIPGWSPKSKPLPSYH